LTGHSEAITGLALSPDGERLATVSADGRTRVWDPLLGQNLIELAGTGSPLCAASFSNKGTRLATLSQTGELCLFETRPMAQRVAAPDTSAGTLLAALGQMQLSAPFEDLLAQRQTGLPALEALLEGAAEALSNPARTLVHCWEVARDASREQSEYQKALSAFEEALPRAAPAPIHHRTQAALALRLGAPDDSLRAIDLALRAGLTDRPDVFAIQALAALRAGLRPLAIDAHNRARELIAEEFWSRDGESLAWFREADAALADETSADASGE
jgi:tetratricopeptide (TPR) repeat protein